MLKTANLQANLFMEEQEEYLPPLPPEDDAVIIPEETIETPIYHKPAGINYWSQFGLLLGLIGAGVVAGSFASIIVVKAMMPHVSLFSLDKALLDPANANAMKVLQLVSTILMFFLPAFLFGLIAYKKPFPYLGFNINISWKQAGLVVLIAWMALFVGSALGDLNERIPIPKHWQDKFKKAEDEYSEQVFAIAKMDNAKDYILAVIIIALIPAIVEETFFRGMMQRFFTDWFRNPWVAIIFTSIIFSAIHMSYYGFLARAMLGVVLGLLYYYGKSIWLNILAHFLNNAVAVTALYIFSMKGKLTKDALEDHFPLWLCLIGSVTLVALLINFKKKSEAFLAEKETIKLQNEFYR